MNKKKEKLHLLKGLRRILLDIDRAIQIIRDTEEDAEVVPNLMIGFGIDQVQAEYVADIRLRNINKEYILKRTQEVDTLSDEIADLEDTVNSPKRIQTLIIGELEEVKKKYAVPRRTDIVFDHEADEVMAVEEEDVYKRQPWTWPTEYRNSWTAAPRTSPSGSCISWRATPPWAASR